MKRVLPAILLFLVSSSAFAWTRGGDERIARKAGQLAPPDLRILIERFEPEYKQGQARAQSDEGSESHRNYAQSGRLRERIERETATAIAMIKSREPMSSVVEQLGVLSHFVADANNPFHTVNDDPNLEASHHDYEQYFERRLAKFPTVFYGLDRNFQLSNEQLHRAADRVEHYIGSEIRDAIASELPDAHHDPHGRQIPET